MQSANHPPQPTPLRLLLQSLEQTDVYKVKTFLSLGQDRLDMPWSVVDQGEAHVVIADGETFATIRGLLDAPLMTVQLTDAKDGAPSDWVLKKPLQYEALLDVLTHAEAAFKARSLRSSKPASRPRVPVAPTSQDHRKFRLKRWPPANVLGGNRQHLRLATFLGMRHIGIDELARLSQLPPEQCAEFVGKLQEAGLLWDDQEPAHPNPRAVEDVPAREVSLPATAPNVPPVPVSLLQRIRQRLGIGGLA